MASKLQDEIRRLADAAVDISKIESPKLRHDGGFWLNSELINLYESTPFWPSDDQLDFMAIVKIMLDVIFRDAVEDASDLTPMPYDLPTSELFAGRYESS